MDLRRRGEAVTVTLADGQVRPADAVVLALGHGAATTNWVPAPLARSPRFVADPWRPGGLPELPAGSTVLLVGSGLTMIDVAINYGHCQLHTVSRPGLLPLAHVPDPPVAQPRPLPGTTFTAASARRLVFDRIRALDGDWRTAVDSLRPVTQQLWSAWTTPTAASCWPRASGAGNASGTGWPRNPALGWRPATLRACSPSGPRRSSRPATTRAA